MRSRHAIRPIAAAICAALLPLTAAATDGYFAHGYGMRAKGMGGASYGLALDSFGGANNPASMVFVGTRLDVGIDWFSPQRSAERSGAAPGLNGSVDSDSTNSIRRLAPARGRRPRPTATGDARARPHRRGR